MLLRSYGLYYPKIWIACFHQSDSGPEFTSKITQIVSASLHSSWHFHIPYRPPSSGKVEWMNGILEQALTKLSTQVYLDWVKLLPLALLRIRSLPKKSLMLSPFEIPYGRPVLLLPEKLQGSCLQARKNSGVRQRVVGGKIARFIRKGHL